MSLPKPLVRYASAFRHLAAIGYYCYASWQHTPLPPEQQVRTVQSLDALLILGGGKEGNTARTCHSVELYRSLTRKSPLLLLFSGRCSGVRLYYNQPLEPRETAVAHWMESYAHTLGVPQENTAVEDESLDTIANMICSQPLLKERGARKIGLVTDAFHMDRSYRFAKRVFGPQYVLSPLATSRGTSLVGTVSEGVLSGVILSDITPVRSGDQQGFERYLHEQHPFHAYLNGNRPLWGAYRLALTAIAVMSSPEDKK